MISIAGKFRGGKSYLLSLLILYPEDKDYPFGLEGGERYLEKTLGQDENIAELNDLRYDVRGAFRTSECFLLPHPGLEVTEESFTGEVTGDRGACFKHHASEFFAHLVELALALENPPFGWDVCRKLEAYFKLFKSGLLSEPKLAVEVRFMGWHDSCSSTNHFQLVYRLWLRMTTLPLCTRRCAITPLAWAHQPPLMSSRQN